MHLELSRIALASGKAGLREIIPDADKLLKTIPKWKLWRIAGKPFQLRDGGLFDQIEEEFDLIYLVESEFQSVAKASGKEGL